MKIKIFNRSSFELPVYETIGAAGMDVRANESVSILPGKTVPVDTGLAFAIPEGYELQVRPRSGLSLKTSSRIANAPGTLDSDYRGTLKVLLWNTDTEKSFPIIEGERIAQIVVKAVPRIEWEPVDSFAALGDTIRGSNGFGSTGKV